MGVIQNSVNQALGIGALIAGKARTDYNNSVMASENIDTKRRKELYNKQMKNGLDQAQNKVQKELNNKFSDRVNKYTGNSIFKNSDLRRYYESQNVDRNIALDQTENDNNEVAAQPIVGQTPEDPEYEKATEEQINEIQNQPSIQQVMAEQQMNKVDQDVEFKRNTKENVELRKEFVKTPKKEKGKYVVNAMTLSGTYNPKDPARNMTVTKAKQEMAKQMELDQKEYENKKKENK